MKRSRIHWVAWALRCPAYRWPDRGSRRARLRRWFWHTVARFDGETCDTCGGRVTIAWFASNEQWSIAYKLATGNEAPIGCGGIRGGLLCAECFSCASPMLWRPEPM
jgi:hypothetical protein